MCSIAAAHASGLAAETFLQLMLEEEMDRACCGAAQQACQLQLHLLQCSILVAAGVLARVQHMFCAVGRCVYVGACH